MKISAKFEYNNYEISAVVLAAGFSSRMNALKSLYPIGDELIIERVIRLLHNCGFGSIHVVTGYKDVLVQKFLMSLSIDIPEITIVFNHDFEQGMFSSVLAGIKSLNPGTEGFMLFPVDYPFIQASTIQKLLTAFYNSSADVISPVCNRINGHPPIIRQTAFKSILGSGGVGGLRAVLANSQFNRLAVELNDEGILDDVDTDEAYIKFMNKYLELMHDYPVFAEIRNLWTKLELPPDLTAHMEKVCEIAVGICEELNASGALLHPGLLSAACRLHDIKKSEANHAAAAGSYLEDLGYPAVADIVSQHIDIDFTAGSKLDEAAVLYLADKMVEGDKIVELENRMNAKIKQFSDRPEVVRNIRIRFDKAFLIQRRYKGVTEWGADC